jgi:hypothetical protein
VSAEPAQVMATLDKLATELDQRSSELADVERKLDPVTDRYDDFYESWVAAMYEDEEGKRLPGEDVRRALAHKWLRKEDPQLLGDYRRLSRRRDRLKRRIETLGRAASAQQSILSALKREMEATGGFR